MSESAKKLTLIKQDLFSGNNSLILNTIENIRLQSNISVIPLLLDLYCVSQNEDVKHAIKKCLFDLKDQHAAGIIVSALSEKKYFSIKSVILESMWQCGLDYSEYAETIVSTICTDTFENTIEAVTVLETIEESIPDTKRSEYSQKLNAAAETKEGSHKALIFEAVAMLD